MDRKVSSRSESSTTLLFFGLTVLLTISSAYLCVSDPFFRAMIALAQQSELLASRYYGEVAPERIFADAWQGMQSAIPFRVDLTFAGDNFTATDQRRDWGLTLSPQDSAVEIVDIAESSPFHGFLLPDDKITGVDTLREDNFVNLVDYLNSRGDGATRIYFERKGRSDSVTVQISTDEAAGGSEFEMTDSIGILRTALPANASVVRHLEAMSASKALGYIVDLRESKGNDYKLAVDLSEKIGDAVAGSPLVILIDASTKGASEEIARRIGEIENTVTMGTPSAGMLSVVDEIKLRSGGSLLVSLNERLARPSSFENDSLTNQGPPTNAVIPTTRCSGQRMSPLVFELLHGGYILDFVTASHHISIPTLAEESVLFDEFKQFLQRRKFRYDPLGHILSDMSLNEMDATMTPVYMRIRKTHQEIRNVDLELYRDEIICNLLRTIHRVKVGGEPTVSTRARTDDACLAIALAYLRGKIQ